MILRSKIYTFVLGKLVAGIHPPPSFLPENRNKLSLYYENTFQQAL